MMSVFLILVSFFLMNLAYSDDGCLAKKEEFSKTLTMLRSTPENVKFSQVQQYELELKNCGFTYQDFQTTEIEMRTLRGKVLLRILPEIIDSYQAKASAGERSNISILKDFLIRDNVYSSDVEKKLFVLSEEMETKIGQFERERARHVNESCQTPRNLSNKLPPVRNQGNLGLCYAHAAADLLYFETGLDFSPLDIALNYVRKNNNEWANGSAPIEGGHIDSAIQASQGKSLCSAKDMDYTGADVEKIKSAMNTLTVIDSLGENFSDEKICNAQESLKNIYHDLSLPEMKKILSHLANQDLFDELRKTSCKERSILDRSFKFKTVSYPDNYRHLDFEFEVLSALESGEPIGVALKNLDFLGIDSQGQGHAMVIIGNQLNPETKQCEFIIRNSWGKDCALQPPKVNCKDGNWIIPSKILKEQKIDTTLIE